MPSLTGSHHFRTLCCLTLLPALLLVATTTARAETRPAHIAVQGEGRTDIAPDMAILSLTVAREDKTARAALDANSTAMAAVIAAMREAGIAERDLQTSGFSIQPRMHYPRPHNNEDRQAPQITGYTVRNSLTVRVRDITRVGEVLDLSVTLGVNQGGQVTWSNQDPAEALRQARSLAVQDAMARAQTLAQAAGVGLGELLELSELSFQPGPVPVAQAEMAMARTADAVPVTRGENSYRVSVYARYRIEQ